MDINMPLKHADKTLLSQNKNNFRINVKTISKSILDCKTINI